MFHILVARFILEANENIPKKCDLKDVSLHFGQDTCSWAMCSTARM